MTLKLAFIGGGNIAQAIIGGLIQSGYPKDSISVADPSDEQGVHIKALGVSWSTRNQAVVPTADLVLLCVKPNLIETVCNDSGPSLGDKPLVSVAAGITTEQLTRWSGSEQVIRCMPNTPALVGTGMLGLFATSGTDLELKEHVERLLSTVGVTAWFTEEADLNAVTAISGSGPAYFFYLMEAMIEAAESFNIDPDTAKTLVIQTALGAANMASRGNETPKTLRENVTSPGGTTEAACRSLEAANFDRLIAAACEAARDRSISLSQNSAP